MGQTITLSSLVARVQGLTDIISEMQSFKNIVEAYNKIFDVIDNQILLLKYEYQSGGWNEVHKSSMLTNFFDSSSIPNIEHTLYAVKIPRKFTVEYNFSEAVRYRRHRRVPITTQYFHGFIDLHPAETKYAPLEIRDGYVEPNIKSDFEFALGDTVYFSGTFSGKFRGAIDTGSSVSLYYNL